MLENKSHFKIKINSEKSFGFTFAILFALIGIYSLIYSENIYLWSFIAAIIFLVITIFLPKILIFPNYLWFKLGMILGAIISPIIMLLLYFLTVTPTGIIMRFFKKDLINLKIYKSKNSYWIKKEKTLESMKNQF